MDIPLLLASDLSIGPQDHSLGPADAPITLIEYGDYACAYCTETYPMVEQLRADLEGNVRFVYRHFPVVSPARSLRAAEAAEAAGEQGYFWQMHELLSRETAALLTEGKLLELARSLDLDMPAFENALQHRLHAERIEEDLESGRLNQVRRTPTFFVNGERYEGALRAEELLSTININTAIHHANING